MTKVYSIFKEGKKKLQRIQYQQPECGHWEATKWTLPSSGASVFVIIIFVIIFIMIISDFSMKDLATQSNICYDSIAIWNPRFTQGLGQGHDEPEFGKVSILLVSSKYPPQKVDLIL